MLYNVDTKKSMATSLGVPEYSGIKLECGQGALPRGARVFRHKTGVWAGLKMIRMIERACRPVMRQLNYPVYQAKDILGKYQLWFTHITRYFFSVFICRQSTNILVNIIFASSICR